MELEERKKIFLEELDKLREDYVIKEKVFHQVRAAYLHFHARQTMENNPFVQKHEVPAAQGQSFNSPEEVRPKPQTVPIQVAKPKPTPPPPPKPKKTEQEIRDRNVTWVLIIGVVLLLMGGLVLATSNWEAMTSVLKTALISCVSLLFFLISWLSGHKLKIKQTAFAFLTLGSLFLPIVIFSAGYFELFGPWLSVFGEGKYVLGVIGSFICMPLYAYHSKRQESRLFVWFSLITLSIGVSFILAAFYPTIDVFFLGIVVYNALVLFGYYRLKNEEKWAIFTKEIPVFAQANLVFSTVLMLFFYENSVFYSFNLILTAVIFLSMIFVMNRKEYNFVFTLLFVYGVYQLIENSILISVDVVLYALVGFMFLFLQSRISSEGYLQKAFQITNAVISFCAFIFISYKGLLLRWEEPSWLLVLAYLLISVNYIFLANVAKVRLFSVLAPVFLVAAGLNMMGLIYDDPTIEETAIHMFLVGTIIFAFGYYWNHWRYTITIKYSSFFVSLVPIVLSMLILLGFEEWLTLAFFLLMFGMLMFVTNRSVPWSIGKEIALWLTPLSWFLAGAALYPELAEFDVYRDTFAEPFHFGAIGLALLGIAYAWKWRGFSAFEKSTFWMAQWSYTWGIFLLFSISTDPLFVRTGLFLVAIPMYYLLVKRIKLTIFWILISISTLAAYLSVVEASWVDGSTLYSFLTIGGAVLLLLLAKFLPGSAAELKQSYFYLAQVYLPIALYFVAIFIDNQPLLFVVAMLIYGYSLWIRKQEWERLIYLYAGFTVLFSFFWSFVEYGQLERGYEPYTVWVTSGIIFVIWLLVNHEWKNRIKWYLLPLAFLGALVFVLYSHPIEYTTIAFLATMSLIVITLVVLHYSKWHLFKLAPLLLVIGALTLLNFSDEESVFTYLVVAAAFFITGRALYPRLFEEGKSISLHYQLDVYAIASILIMLTVYEHINWNAPLWMKEIPALFISGVIFLQIKRVGEGIPQKMAVTAALISALYPYYVLLNNISINQYIEVELYVLPWVALVIFLEKRTWKANQKLMDLLLWGVLIVVASLLIFDGLESNTIYDALIVGGLSLLSLVAGFYYRRKSFFFIGSGMLLLNVMMQTRPYWGRLPWWAYLLIAGSVLIAVASFYEWQKQKKDERGQTILQAQKKKWADKWTEWQ